MSYRDKKVEDTSIAGTFVRALIARFSSDHLLGKKIKNGELRRKWIEPPWTAPDGFLWTEMKYKEFEMEWLEAEKSDSDYVLLQLHGGGYVGTLHNAYRNFAVLYSELGNGMSVLTINYRVAPKHPYPAALEDAVCAYEWLLEKGYDSNRILVAGDSAGGGLALALVMYLRDHGAKLPAGIIAMSPWTDLTASGESYQSNYEKDPLFGNTKDSLIYNREYVGLEDPKNPYISPAFGEFDDFPPVLIQVGSYETLLSDSETVARKAREKGVKVRLHVYEGMFHVFQMAMQLMPESRLAWKEVGKFLNVVCESEI